MKVIQTCESMSSINALEKKLKKRSINQLLLNDDREMGFESEYYFHSFRRL